MSFSKSTNDYEIVFKKVYQEYTPISKCREVEQSQYKALDYKTGDIYLIPNPNNYKTRTDEEGRVFAMVEKPKLLITYEAAKKMLKNGDFTSSEQLEGNI